MLVSVYLCKNLNRKRAAAGSESTGDVVPPKEKCGASGKERGQKRLLDNMPQGAGAFRRGCRGCGKTDALNREGRSLSCRRKKNAARQAKSAGQKTVA